MSTTPNSATHGMPSASLSFSNLGNTMQYVTHNQETIDTNMSYKQANLSASYEELVDMFGKPTDGDGNKVDVAWHIKFADGTIATIHNWKNGKAYNGESGTPTEQINSWSIGGYDNRAGDLVRIAVDLHREQKEAEASKPKTKKEKLEQSLESAFEMMDTIRATKGLGYAHAVEIAMLTHKMLDLVHILIQRMVDVDEMPESSANDMGKVFALITSRIIGLAARSGNENKELSKQDAKELMDWAERIMQREKEGAIGFLNDMLGKDD